MKSDSIAFVSGCSSFGSCVVLRLSGLDKLRFLLGAGRGRRFGKSAIMNENNSNVVPRMIQPARMEKKKCC